MNGVHHIDPSLLRDIKFNCDVSDARFWGSFSICGLLMRYRDLYRSEQGRDPWAPVGREEIGPWIQRKEAGWPALENEPFRDLEADGARFDSFDDAALNGLLLPHGFVYGAGYGMYLKPTFFLARSVSTAMVEGHTVHVADRELVRDLFTAPAMLRERTIFIRREPVRALLWDRFCPLRPDSASVLAGAFAAFGIRPGRPLDGSFPIDLDRMVLSCSRMLLRHELAESREALPGWKDLLSAAGDRKAELFLRAVQDLVADLSDRGPLDRIVEERDGPSLALFIGLPEGYRRSLAPELDIAFRRFHSNGDWTVMDEARRSLFERFVRLRAQAAVLAGVGRQDLREGLAGLMRQAGA
jgi:hypothetical protein